MPTRCSLVLLTLIAACTDDPSPLAVEVTYTEERSPCSDRNPLRNLYFGDLHFHTRHSWDAYGYQLTATPEEGFAFARGTGKVRLPPLDAEGRGTREVALPRPLDFAAGTDHGELLGEVRICVTPGLPGHDSAACQSFRQLGENAVVNWGIQLIYPEGHPRLAEICGADGAACRSAARTVWDSIRAAAEAANDRSAACSFAAFAGYEYSASPMVTNQHRTVVFRNSRTPELPISYYEQPTAVGLWRELARQCLDAGSGCQVMAVPHNSNWSNGTLYASSYIISQGKPLGLDEKQLVALRARLEPVAEIQQHKGDMECSPGLSNSWSDDPQCSFEKIRVPPFEDCGEGTGQNGVREMGCVSKLDFIRGVLAERLRDRQRLGELFPLGVIGSTDTHNATPGNTDEAGWPGHVGVADDLPEDRLGPGNSTHRGLNSNPGGLAAVWAFERSRDAIFEALQRRETYSTSGPRIAVRLFAGWDLPDRLCDAGDRIERAYRRGVPMGGRLGPRTGATPPRLFVEASADPGTAARPGTPLREVSIVKGWLDAAGLPHEKVYVVAGSAQSGASVDPATCQPSGAGARSLCADWVDPDFDAERPAFYYARVLENPTCRWSTRDCNALPVENRPAACTDAKVPRVIQERAITSAIWYVP